MDDMDRTSNSSVGENESGFTESEADQHAILGTVWGSVAAWRQQMLLIATQYSLSEKREKKINRDAARAEFLATLTSERDAECISQLRMDTETFKLLCHTMRARGLLRDTRAVSVEEAVAEFLHTLSHSVRNRTNSVRFHRSGETISRHFREVLFAINSIATEVLVQAGEHTPRGPNGFEDCVGALDGTHIPVRVPLEIQGSFRNRKGSLSQNVLGACGFDMNFQYVLPGWEGSATDARVLQSALIREDNLKVPQAMSKGRNVTFNAVMDEELLDGMYEQVLLGRKADRGFKGEAYEAVAAAMTANSNGEYVLTKQSIVNRCKYHKKNYSIATELLNASGFGYDNTTKRIIAADDVWTAWIEGHPDAKPYRAKVIDYDKLTQIFGADVATGQYARSATTAPSRASCESDSRYYNPSQADSDVGLTDQINGFRMASSGGEGSSKRKNNRKRSSEMLEIISCIERSGEGLKAAIHDVADSLRMPKKKAADMIMVELKQIAELSGLDMSLAHEWLTIHGNMATVFLSTDEKRDWILRQLPKIKSELIG